MNVLEALEKLDKLREEIDALNKGSELLKDKGFNIESDILLERLNKISQEEKNLQNRLENTNLVHNEVIRQPPKFNNFIDKGMQWKVATYV